MKTFDVMVAENVCKNISVSCEDEDELKKYLRGEIHLEVIYEEIISCETQHYKILDQYEE